MGLIIAIDGHSSCGKSTFAKGLAKESGYMHIDSGAMYRAVTYYCLMHNVIENKRIKHEQLEDILSRITLSFEYNDKLESQQLLLNGQIVDKELRTPEVSAFVSRISTIDSVRMKMIAVQRNMSQRGGIVMEGRDIGTVVFPDADIKIFMTAKLEIRAQRRHEELIEKGFTTTYEEVLENLRERDYQDEHRKNSPLIRAKDAYVLDSGKLTVDKEIEWAVTLIKKKQKAKT